MVRMIVGDAIQLAKSGEYTMLVHGCNCRCTMGKGFALQVKEHFPEAWKEDLKTKHIDPRYKLGKISYAKNYEHKIWIVNAYTQVNYYSPTGERLFDYKAFRLCLKQIVELEKKWGAQKILMPMIGAGLAKGYWPLIHQEIVRTLGDSDVTIACLTENDLSNAMLEMTMHEHDERQLLRNLDSLCNDYCI